MPIELYETMFAIDANKMATDGDSIKNSLTGTIEKFGGEILVARAWNENQKLAYPINKQKKGYYFIVYYKFESTKQRDFETDLRLNMTEFLLRHLTSHIDYRYEEVMLHIARDEQGNSFALRGLNDEPSPTDITPANINDPNAPALGNEYGPVPNLNDHDPAPTSGRRRRDSEKPD